MLKPRESKQLLVPADLHFWSEKKSFISSASMHWFFRSIVENRFYKKYIYLQN